jgi:hypothetical protein
MSAAENVTTGVAIDAAIVRFLHALKVLGEAPANLLVPHVEALDVALSTIDALIIVVGHSRTLGDISTYH